MYNVRLAREVHYLGPELWNIRVALSHAETVTGPYRYLPKGPFW
jgi:hypothetical protein